MGVHGLTRLLREEGFLPADTDCVTTLWRRTANGANALLTDEAQNRLVQIPPFSTLALDGNGLAYYLHHVAYSRHFNQVTGSSDGVTSGKQSSSCCCCKTRHLSETQVTLLLPQNLPLALLDQVTKEFVESLQRNHMQLVVYWDGDDRRMKAATTRERKEGRDTEWSHLKQYSMYGVVPHSISNNNNSTLCRKDWLYNFPLSRLLLRQVRFTLQRAGIAMIQCQEEADREVAKASADSDNCYSVGLDSDYCLFPRTRYLPLNTLDASGTVVSACVVTRAEIAEQLDLPQETSMVELAILMGNDYVDNAKEAQLDFVSSKPEEIVDHIREEGPDYLVSSKLQDVELAMRFTRALYEFQDLSEFPFDDDSDSDSSEQDEKQEILVDALDRPVLPRDLDISLAEPSPLDFSVAKVVARPIQVFIDSQQSKEKSLIRQVHLDAYQHLVERLQNEPSRMMDDSEIVRPVWGDIEAAYVIERVIAHVFREYPSSPPVRISSPTTVFDHTLFHSLLKTASKSENARPGTEISVAKSTDDEGPAKVERPKLPIDEHEAEILDAVAEQRVTIIHGETGCGKSSRVPVMLLRAPPPDPSMNEVKMFISQPRRIAAKSLVERVRACEPDLKNSVALRMGHGVREYENTNTRARFVTTGYLVRLLANHPEKFDDCSHIIIDEVHERSVDTDILCLLCRRLLDSNQRIRLILMSATLAANLYQDYFGIPEPPIFVGARRFPIKEYYMEDLMKRFSFSPADVKAAKAIISECERSNCTSPPSNSHVENLYRLAARVVMCAGRPGSSILVFVSGMNDIISITDLIEKLYVPGLRYSCYPIHSDVPFEEQMLAFESPPADEVKVVIATNAAESSVTLPDVDHVICLGMCKQIAYNASSHRQMLMPAWISRASAIQRAGRTGRVRNGNVYRLYTRAAFEEGMDQFETGEMLRIPLDSVILTLKEMLQEEATPILLQCLEPPDLSTIDKSFKSLCKSNFISDPDDSGQITTLGKFVSSLGIDLTLGSLIGLGVQFGVGPEAVELAAILSFPKTPWIMTSPLFHGPPEFNDITRRTFSSRCHFDANLYSEPLATMNLIWDYERSRNRNGWAWHYSVSAPRLRRLVTTRNSLRSRVAEFVGVDAETLRVQMPPVRMEHAKITLLRLIQVWVFSDTMIESIHACSAIDGAVTVPVTGDKITQMHLEQVLDPDRYGFDFESMSEIDQSGTFSPVSNDSFSMSTFLSEFEPRFVSFSVEKDVGVFWFVTEEVVHFFARKQIVESTGFSHFSNTRLARFDHVYVAATLTNTRRGVKERPCGLWDVRTTQDECDVLDGGVLLSKWTCARSDVPKQLLQSLNRQIFDFDCVMSSLCCTFKRYGKKKGRRSPGFSLMSRGKCSEVSKTDLHDLFATSNVTVSTRESQSATQNIVFSPSANSPIHYDKQSAELTTGDHALESSWHRPLLNDVAEGARLLSVLASGRRKEHSIRLSPDEESDIPINEKEEDSYLEVFLNKKETKISQRWRQFSSDRSVYVAENSVPASAMSTQGPIEVFACCANTLEVRGGGLRVEGLTLLPPGRLFALLSFLTFGFQPFTTGKMFDDNEDESLLSQSLRWLGQWDDMVASVGDLPPEISPDVDKVERILAANAFHRSCAELGESLVCHPSKVRDLCAIFDMVDGYSVVPWDGLDENPLTEDNLRRGKSTTQGRMSHTVPNGSEETPATATASRPEGKETSKKARTTSKAGKDVAGESAPPKPTSKRQGKQKTSANGNSKFREAAVVDTFPEAVRERTARLFVMQLDPGESVDEMDLPSTNILCVIVKHYCDFVLQHSLMPDDKNIELEGQVSLTERHWLVRSVQDHSGKEWYLAEFVGTIMPFLSLKKRGGRLPGWMHNCQRPTNVKQAMACVPAQLGSIPCYTTKIVFSECESGRAVFFETIEMALRMEASFWLERQFGNSTHHWYQQTLEEMMAKAITLETVVPRED